MFPMSPYEFGFAAFVHFGWAFHCIQESEAWFTYAVGVVCIQLVHRVYVRVGR